MTFSIVARCAETGMFGVAVSSSSPAVAARCAHARAGIGAVASQNVTDPSLGARALDLLALGADAGQVVDVLRGSAPHMEFRQVLVVDGRGGSAIHSGPRALGTWAEARAADVACGGNMLADAGVPQAMVDAFGRTGGPLGDRLIAAMRAALAAGGEAGPVHSAGMMLVREVSWPVADLRVDWTEDCPIDALAALWERYKPQLDDYVTRARDPSAAPSYGVPGDL
ncbi:DUF1028 domain-containing protein [Methylobacterium aerolatum]|uniref:Ntn-hydrolase superfamily protein n=1 Tax=Methylobacterium aerolatum TaxID=418708 RepID=A0ABU0I500_9HYPH|nr:DUF1028 domain-containing protein [Methylobacterium aerolatum]MDQ0448736.1 putative Ntn-hydrolase superfamily protein [Methylobacterium aerolatum]GJD34940.1 hypothetical protein FMGBMHLM_1847 [Methylobacterium aerolatum]